MNVKKEAIRFNENLDALITLNELTVVITRLKNGKAFVEDLISIEFLKSSNEPLLKAILHLFNQCLQLGVYPWSTSLVTPLHRKGDLYTLINIERSQSPATLVSSSLNSSVASPYFQKDISPRHTKSFRFCKNA